MKALDTDEARQPGRCQAGGTLPKPVVTDPDPTRC